MGDRVKATNAFIIPLEMDLDSLRQSLRAKPIDLKSLPQGLLRDWVTQEGRERVDILPKGNPNHDKTIATFARAVLVAEPAATGPAIEILKWAEAMIKSLIQAAAIAFCAIATVALTLVPLLVAALATLEICALTGFKLNYANIIAFPVLWPLKSITSWHGGGTRPTSCNPR